MIKKLTIIVLFAITSLHSAAQSISPDIITEFCPLVNITFTVTLPRIAANTSPTVASWTNTPIVVSGASNVTHTATQPFSLLLAGSMMLMSIKNSKLIIHLVEVQRLFIYFASNTLNHCSILVLFLKHKVVLVS